MKAYNELMKTIFNKEELDTLEYIMGAILSENGSEIKKLIMLGGEVASGKSTFLKILESVVYDNYLSFNIGDLKNNTPFCTQYFRHQPYIGVSEDVCRINCLENKILDAIINHTTISIDIPFKTQQSIKPISVLFATTNESVLATDNILFIETSGNTIERSKYFNLMDDIKTELHEIRKHCVDKFDTMKNESLNIDTYQFKDTSNAFEYEHGKVHGDQTSTYIMHLNGTPTLRECVEQVVNNASEWGEIKVKKEMHGLCKNGMSWKYAYGRFREEENLMSCDYKHGVLLGTIPKQYLDMTIISATGNGGWSLSDFTFTVKEIK